MIAKPKDELQRDIAVVFKHLRLIIGLLAAAIIVALISGFASSSTYSSSADVEVTVNASGLRTENNASAIPTPQDFQAFALSDEVVRETLEKLGRDESELDSFKAKLTASAQPPTNAQPTSIVLTLAARDTSSSEATSIAQAWIETFVERASEHKVDPARLRNLEQQVETARERFETVNASSLPEAGEDIFQVQSELTAKRETLADFNAQEATLDHAIAFVNSQQGRSLNELQIAVSGILGEGTESLVDAGSVEELLGGLELRKELLQTSIGTLSSDIQSLSEREVELETGQADRVAALQGYRSAVKSLEEAELAAELTNISTEIRRPISGASGGVNWVARLGAAVAFALVVGVAGAFALEFLGPLSKRWRR